MGLGKTIQAIGALRVLRRNAAPALIVVPASLVLQWRAQLRAWAPELTLSTAIGPADERQRAWKRDAAVYLTSYDCLRSDILLRLPAGPGRRTWAVVVADEAQRFKNAHTLSAQVMRRLTTRRAWALTGTPLENGADDLVSIMDFVAPGAFDPAGMMAGLQALLATHMLRRRRIDVLDDLPPKTVTVIDPGLTPVQRRAYAIAEEAGIVWLRSLGDRVQVAHVLELLLRLKQICNAEPETGQSGKLDDLDHRVNAVAGEGMKTLVFSQFVERPFGIHAIADRLRRFRPLLVTGGQHPAARAQTLSAFRHDPGRQVLLLSLKAGGVGLNLTSACCVVHFDRWWTAAVEQQAEDRAHRIGQTRPVQVCAYVCGDTFEHRIAAIIAAKRTTANWLVDGIDADPAGLSLAELLTVAGAS